MWFKALTDAVGALFVKSRPPNLRTGRHDKCGKNRYNVTL